MDTTKYIKNIIFGLFILTLCILPAVFTYSKLKNHDLKDAENLSLSIDQKAETLRNEKSALKSMNELFEQIQKMNMTVVQGQTHYEIDKKKQDIKLMSSTNSFDKTNEVFQYISNSVEIYRNAKLRLENIKYFAEIAKEDLNSALTGIGKPLTK